MHDAGGGSVAAITDLTAIETTGLDVTYSGNDPSKPAQPFATLTYGPSNPLPSPAPGTTTIGATWTGYLCAPQDGDYNIQITADPSVTVTLSSAAPAASGCGSRATPGITARRYHSRAAC